MFAGRQVSEPNMSELVPRIQLGINLQQPLAGIVVHRNVNLGREAFQPDRKVSFINGAIRVFRERLIACRNSPDEKAVVVVRIV